MEKCKFCNSDIQKHGVAGIKEIDSIECPVCGWYDMTHSGQFSSIPSEITDEEIGRAHV